MCSCDRNELEFKFELSRLRVNREGIKADYFKIDIRRIQRYIPCLLVLTIISTLQYLPYFIGIDISRFPMADKPTVSRPSEPVATGPSVPIPPTLQPIHGVDLNVDTSVTDKAKEQVVHHVSARSISYSTSALVVPSYININISAAGAIDEGKISFKSGGHDHL